jgi:hypothetical protein
MSAILPSRLLALLLGGLFISDADESLERTGLGGGGLLGEWSDLEDGGEGAALVALKEGEGERLSLEGFLISGERCDGLAGDLDGSMSKSCSRFVCSV